MTIASEFLFWFLVPELLPMLLLLLVTQNNRIPVCVVRCTHVYIFISLFTISTLEGGFTWESTLWIGSILRLVICVNGLVVASNMPHSWQGFISGGEPGYGSPPK